MQPQSTSQPTLELGSPMWWLQRMEFELMRRRPHMVKLDDWYSGRHPFPFVTKTHTARMMSEFHGLLADSQANFMELVVDVCAERLRVEGFRVSAATTQETDQQTWTQIWQPNQMDQESQTAMLEALIKGVSYLSVWADDQGKPTISVEDPAETIVAYVPGTNFRQRAAALKVWRDDINGVDRANVYLPNGIYKYQANDVDAAPDEPIERRWVELDFTGVPQMVPNPLGVVPIIPLRNRPRLLAKWDGVEGTSEIENVWRLQSQINAFMFLEALAGYAGAHRQRWASGIKLMIDERTGEPVQPWDATVDKLWISENPDTKFGDFQQTDLSNYTEAIDQKVQQIAMISRTPKYYMLQQGQDPSGDSIKSSESGLVKKAELKQRPFGEAFEEAIRLARQIAGMQDTPPDSEVVWADPQTRTEAETTDAVIKLYSADLIPWAAALELAGYSPQQIQRFEAMRVQDALVKNIAGAVPEYAPAPAPEQVLPESVQA